MSRWFVAAACVAAPGVAAAGDIIDTGPTTPSTGRFEIDGRRLVRSNPDFKDVFDDSGGASVADYPWTSTGVWPPTQPLTPPVKQAGQRYGQGLAVSGDFIAVSAPEWLDQNVRKGVVYIWTLVDDEWVIHSTLLSPSPSAESFGTALAMEGTTLVVGAAKNDEKGASAGKGYFFRREGMSWVLEGEALPDDLVAGDLFGDQDQTGRVSLHGDTAAFGVPYKDGGAGAVYVYVRTNQTWSLQAKVEAVGKLVTDRFGHATALQDDTLAVGAIHAKDANNVDTGALYVFERAGDVWTQTHKLVPPNTTLDSRLGSEVELDGKWISVSAHYSDLYLDNAGYVHVYRRAGNDWELFKNLQPIGGLKVYGVVQSLEPPILLVRGSSPMNVAQVYRIGADAGDPCDGPVEDVECRSYICVDAVCCDEPCDLGDPDNCQACSVATGSFADGHCANIEENLEFVCRPATSDCDLAEACIGGKTCPADQLKPDEAPCAGGFCSAGTCEAADTTTGGETTGNDTTTGNNTTTGNDTTSTASTTDDVTATSGGTVSTTSTTATNTGATQSSGEDDSTGTPATTGGPASTGDAPTSGPTTSGDPSTSVTSASSSESGGGDSTGAQATGEPGADPAGCGCTTEEGTPRSSLLLAALWWMRRRRPRRARS